MRRPSESEVVDRAGAHDELGFTAAFRALGLFLQPGASPGGGVGIVGSGDGVIGDALSDGDALSPGETAAAGDSGDAADGTADGAGSLDWFDFAQPAADEHEDQRDEGSNDP